MPVSIIFDLVKNEIVAQAGFALFFLVKETGFGMILFLGVYATWLEAKVHYPDLKLPEIPGLKFEF